MQPNRVKITRTNSRHQHIETTQTYIGRPEPLQLSTGSEIEAEEDERINIQQQRYRGEIVSTNSTKLMPIFLKAVPKLEATLISIPPPIDEQSYQINELISQPLNAAILLLTPSVQVRKENVQQIFSSRKNQARRIHVISSPIYEVQYECSPPSQKIEPLQLSNKKSVAELLLKPPKAKKAEIFDQIWLTTKFEVAYGKHSAVPTTISRTQKQRITKGDAERRKGKFTSALSVMPQAPVQIKQLIKAPPINTVELCCIDSTVEAKKIKEIYVEESEYQVIRTEDYSYTESTTFEYTR